MDTKTIFDRVLPVKLALRTYNKDPKYQPPYWKYEYFTTAVWNSVLNGYFPISDVDKNLGYMLAHEYYIPGTEGRPNSFTDIVLSLMHYDRDEEGPVGGDIPFLSVECKRDANPANSTWEKCTEQLMHGMNNLMVSVGTEKSALRPFWGLVAQGVYCKFYQGELKSNGTKKIAPIGDYGSLNLTKQEDKEAAAHIISQMSTDFGSWLTDTYGRQK